MSAEATVVRNYIDWIIALPWGEFTRDRWILMRQSISLMMTIMASRNQRKDFGVSGCSEPYKKIKGPILCLAGPPGVARHPLPGLLQGQWAGIL
jgi:ATP-dependent Lon protease